MSDMNLWSPPPVGDFWFDPIGRRWRYGLLDAMFGYAFFGWTLDDIQPVDDGKRFEAPAAELERRRT